MRPPHSRRKLLAVAACALFVGGAIVAIQFPEQVRDTFQAKPETLEDIAHAACQWSVGRMIKSPASMKVIEGGGTLDKGTTEIEGIEHKLTTTVFQFDAQNTYGAVLRHVASCEFAWPIVSEKPILKPSLVEIHVDGHLPEEITLLAIRIGLLNQDFR